MTGKRGVLTMGTGPDHSLIDVYIDGSLWQSYDCYSETVSERDITLPRGNLMEIRNRSARNLQSSGTVIRFKQLATYSLSFDETVIDYTYDALSRLLQADYDNGTTVYNYGYDVAGNLVNNNGTSRTYNAANQMTHDGTNTLTYDNNGNLTAHGVESYDWDRANRMIAHNNLLLFDYDGDGNRVRQIVADGLPVITDYLNDVQPELTKLLRQSNGTTTEHFIHAPRGVHAVDDGTAWNWYAQDGLGSVRGLVDNSALLQSIRSYDPYGKPFAIYPTGFGFTGEQTDVSGNVFLRARYYDPELGIFPSLDPFEGVHSRPMSLNGYSWVENDPVNNVDPSGMCVAETSACAAAIASPFDLIFGDAIACTAAIACLAQAGYGAYQIHQMLIQETGAPYENVENAVSQAMQNNTSSTLQPMLTSITPFTDLYCMPGVSSIPQSYVDSQSQTSEQTHTHEQPIAGFDLAFGIDTYLFVFAATFTERPALPFLDWPDEMITLPNGDPIVLMNRSSFRAEFDYMMGVYLGLVPDGRFKFNLGGMDNSEPSSLTTWELERISISPVYSLKTDYYQYEGIDKIALTESEARTRISSILGTN